MLRCNPLLNRHGVSLIEVMAAAVIAIAATYVAISSWPSRHDVAAGHACAATRASIQFGVDAYFHQNSRMPASLYDSRYLAVSDIVTPRCPQTNERYSAANNGIVTCPNHGQTPVD